MAVCERRKLRMNMRKGKVMRCVRMPDGSRLNVRLNKLLEVEIFTCLSSAAAVNGRVDVKVWRSETRK